MKNPMSMLNRNYGLVSLKALNYFLKRFTSEMGQEVEDFKRVLSTSKPKSINFQANDICNARCVMCNIWKDGTPDKMTLEEFERLLRDPYFSDVEQIGITGGEPTLHQHLFDLYEISKKNLPSLSGASFITNGFLPTRAVDVYSKIHQSFLNDGLLFSGMVSIDGLGAVHDRVRGRQGAFEKAIQTFHGLQNEGIAVSLCCTVVKENVYDLYELLQWCIENNIHIRFRIAEFIKRLYNENLDGQIRFFSEHEVRHLIAFFHFLIVYEQWDFVRKTYYSILSMLSGGERLVKCPYRTLEAISIGSAGAFMYCSPQGEPHQILGDARKIVAKHRAELFKIRRTQCKSCIHDYHSDWNFIERVDRKSQDYLDDLLEKHLPKVRISNELEGDEFDSISWRQTKRILLIGWYGTETAGDIAILGGIVSELLEYNDQLKFTLFSLNPFYTKVTVQDLTQNISSRIQVSSYQGREAFQAMISCDMVIMAGGPLMDVDAIGKIEQIFRWFHRMQKPSVIYGCGVGPLNQLEHRLQVQQLAELASLISVRDSASKELLISLGIQKNIEVRFDPAYTYIKNLGVKHSSDSNGPIRCFLRELTSEYPQSTSPEQAFEFIIDFLEKILAWFPNQDIQLLAMHYFPIGGDDREYAKKIVKQINSRRISLDILPRTPEEIVQFMSESSFCICMRFHSVLFANSINAPYIAIDYTNGGKITGFLKDIGKLDKAFTLDALSGLNLDDFHNALQ